MRSQFLPILTMDEHGLSPSFGYVFDRRWLQPYESIVSILWKFVRVNALAGHEVAGRLGHEVVDPYEGIAAEREAIDIRRLKNELGVTGRTLREALISARRRSVVSPYFRYCAKCLGQGYHSVMHQVESVLTCPIHDRTLEIACRHCGYSEPYRLTARLLDRPYMCTECRLLYGTQWPKRPRRCSMPMEDLIRLLNVRRERPFF